MCLEALKCRVEPGADGFPKFSTDWRKPNISRFTHWRCCRCFSIFSCYIESTFCGRKLLLYLNILNVNFVEMSSKWLLILDMDGFAFVNECETVLDSRWMGPPLVSSYPVMGLFCLWYGLFRFSVLPKSTKPRCLPSMAQKWGLVNWTLFHLFCWLTPAAPRKSWCVEWQFSTFVSVCHSFFRSCVRCFPVVVVVFFSGKSLKTWKIGLSE